MPYERTTWVDEILDDAEQFEILDSAGAAVDAFEELATCKIQLETTIDTPGTPIDAEHLNNMEEGIVALATGAGRSVKGVPLGAGSDVEDIVAGTDGHVLRRLGADIGFGQTVAAGIANNAVETAKIKDANVTLTKLADDTFPDAVLATRSAVQSIPSGTLTEVLWDTEAYDHGGLHDLVSNIGRLTAQKDGIYIYTINGGFILNTNYDRNLYVYKNGSEGTRITRRSYGDTDVYSYFSLSGEIDLDEDDYINVYVHQNKGYAVDFGRDNDRYPSFSLHYVRPN